VCATLNQVREQALPAQGHYAEPEAGPPEPPRESAPLAPLCPRCPRALADDAEREGLSCAACGGVFVEHGVLASLVDSARPADRTKHARHAAHIPPGGGRVGAASYPRCPACSQPMTAMNFGRRSGIIVDVCRAHGTWFDRGELDAILEFVGAGGIEPDVEAREAQRSEPSSCAELTPEARRLVKEAEAAMRAEALAAQVGAAAFVRAADDLVWILFGPGYRYRRR
jgi:Zn-finger nucleic acid-binding protein